MNELNCNTCSSKGDGVKRHDYNYVSSQTTENYLSPQAENDLRRKALLAISRASETHKLKGGAQYKLAIELLKDMSKNTKDVSLEKVEQIIAETYALMLKKDAIVKLGNKT